MLMVVMVTMVIVLAAIVLVVLLVVVLLCLHRNTSVGRHKQSNADIYSKPIDDTTSYRESSAYEEIPVIIKKSNKTKTAHSEYRSLDQSTMTSRDQQYASLYMGTCSSRTSLASNISGHDLTNKTKRQGIVIPSLTIERCTQSSQAHRATNSKESDIECLKEENKCLREEEAICQPTPMLSRKWNYDQDKQAEKPTVSPKKTSQQRSKKHPKYENVILDDFRA